MKTTLLSLFGAGAALASSPLPRNLEADDFANLFLQFAPVVFDLGGAECELQRVGQLEFTQEVNNATLLGTGATLLCPAAQLNLQSFDFGMKLSFESDDINIPSSVSFDVDFCAANFASNIDGLPAQQEGAIAGLVCNGINAALIPDLDALVAELSATVGERPTFVPLVQSEVPGNVELPSGFSILNIPNEGLALLEFFTVTLGESVPVVNLTQEAIADFREIQAQENPDFFDFLPPIQELIRLISGDETFVLDEVTAGPILASPEFQDLINPATEIDAQQIIALLDVVFAQPAFAALLPVEYAEVRDQVAQVITIVFGFLIEEDAQVDPIARLLQTENLLQLTFQQFFSLFVEGFHTVFSFLDGFTLADAAGFLQEQGISTGNGNEIGAIFQLVPLDTTLSEVPAVLGQVPVGQYAALQVPGSVGDILFTPFTQTPNFGFILANNMDEAVQFILSLGFTVVNDALGGIFIDTNNGFPATYSGAFIYLSVATGIAGADPLISQSLIGLEFLGPAALLEFLTFEDPLVALSVNATRVRIDAPLDISLVTEVAQIFVGLGTVAPLFVGSNVEVIVEFEISALNGTFFDSGEVVGNYNIAEIPGFTVVSNIQPIFDFNFEQVTTWPDAFTALPFFATCTVGSFGVAHVGHSSVVTSETTLSGDRDGFTALIEGPLADAVNGFAAIYSNLLGTAVDQAAVETLFQPVFLVDVGTSCTDDPFFVEENDDGGLLGDIPTEALIGAGVVVVALLLLVIFFVSSAGSGKYDDEDEEAIAVEAEAKMAVVAEEAEKKDAMEDKL